MTAPMDALRLPSLKLTIPDAQCMAYLPTKLGSFGGFHVGNPYIEHLGIGPENRVFPKRIRKLPTIHFQVAFAVSFREGT